MTQVKDKFEIFAHKDHPVGGFRLYRKNGEDLWAAEIMDDFDTLSEDPHWDLRNWIENLPDPAKLTYRSAEKLYPIFYRLSNDHHGAWNVCSILQDYLPRNT